MKISRLDLIWRHAEGRGQILLLDYLVDDHLLKDRIPAYRGVSPIGWTKPDFEEEILAFLLLEKSSDLPGGRAPLFVCPECGDLGCGAIAAKIAPFGDQIEWRDFAWVNDCEDAAETIEDAGAFRFDRMQYRNALSNPPKRPAWPA